VGTGSPSYLVVFYHFLLSSLKCWAGEVESRMLRGKRFFGSSVLHILHAKSASLPRQKRETEDRGKKGSGGYKVVQRNGV